MKRLRHRQESARGAALIIALSLLAIFSMLGVAWINYMQIEWKEAADNEALVRAHVAAEGGVQAAIGAAEAALAGNKLDGLLSAPLSFEFPVYVNAAGNEAKLQASENYTTHTKVTLTDESAKINVNHAPPNVLRGVLHVDGERARQIRANLPRLDGSPGDAGRRWLTSVDELMTRGLLSPKEFNAVDRSLLTVYTVSNPAKPSAYLDINRAPKGVIEAVLDVTPEVADKVIAARPFATVEALSAAAGKTPDMFNMRSDPSAPSALSKELSLSPRSLRIVSETEVMKPLRDALPGEKVSAQRVATARAEAVIVFEEGGGARVTYWSEARPQ